jgi:hypothetical protein
MNQKMAASAAETRSLINIALMVCLNQPAEVSGARG